MEGSLFRSSTKSPQPVTKAQERVVPGFRWKMAFGAEIAFILDQARGDYEVKNLEKTLIVSMSCSIVPS